MDIKEFELSMATFLSRANKVKSGSVYSDCCGRTSHSDNVFVMPVSMKDDFLDFIGKLNPTEEEIGNMPDGQKIPNCYVVIKYTDGRYSHPGLCRDYDGIKEMDMAPTNVESIGWLMVTFSIGTKHNGKVTWEPFDKFGITKYYDYGDAYRGHCWMAYRNVVCFK